MLPDSVPRCSVKTVVRVMPTIFPWLGYSNTYNLCITTNSYTVNCNGQRGSAGDRLYNTVDALCTGSCATCSSSCTAGTAYTSFQSNAGNSAFINYLNGPNPANYIVFTPTDCHSMHDSCGQTSKVRNGDYYIGNLLCGCSAWNSTAIALSGTVFASSLWTSGRTILMLWWDENSISPQVVIGSGIKSNFVSNTFYDEYYTLHTIERNWGISYINSVVAGDTSLTEIFVPALVTTGPGSIVACSQCTMNVQYTPYTVDNSGTSTYSSNAPSQGPTPWGPSSGSKTMGLDDQLTVTLTFGGSNYTCNTGQFTSMFTVNGVQRQLSTHINCAIAPGH